MSLVTLHFTRCRVMHAGVLISSLITPRVPHRSLKNPQAGCVHQQPPPPAQASPPKTPLNPVPRAPGALLIPHDWNSPRLGSGVPQSWHQVGHPGSETHEDGKKPSAHRGLPGDSLVCWVSCLFWGTCLSFPYSASGFTCRSRWAGSKDLSPTPQGPQTLELCYILNFNYRSIEERLTQHMRSSTGKEGKNQSYWGGRGLC